MGRSEGIKKQSKVLKVSKMERRNIKQKKSKDVKAKAKPSVSKVTQIDQIDNNDNYILPSNFKIGEEDIQLFERLNALKETPSNLEQNLKAQKEEAIRRNPSLDPEVQQVYEK